MIVSGSETRHTAVDTSRNNLNFDMTSYKRLKVFILIFKDLSDLSSIDFMQQLNLDIDFQSLYQITVASDLISKELYQILELKMLNVKIDDSILHKRRLKLKSKDNPIVLNDIIVDNNFNIIYYLLEMDRILKLKTIEIDNIISVSSKL